MKRTLFVAFFIVTLSQSFCEMVKLVKFLVEVCSSLRLFEIKFLSISGIWMKLEVLDSLFSIFSVGQNQLWLIHLPASNSNIYRQASDHHLSVGYHWIAINRKHKVKIATASKKVKSQEPAFIGNTLGLRLEITINVWGQM